jgi:hypothetical protein
VARVNGEENRRVFIQSVTTEEGEVVVEVEEVEDEAEEAEEEEVEED